MIIKINVKPNSKKQEIIKVSENEYKVFLKSQAREGKANVELIKLLKKYLNKPVRIKTGLTSRNKLIEVLG